MLTRGLTVSALLISVSLFGCGNDGEDVVPTSASYPEATLRIEIETLDTGLVKGHAFAEAEDGWTVSSFSVEARDDKGVAWQVIEPDVSGVGGTDVSEFFEVVVQELPRGGELTVEAVATLQDAGGSEIERRVADTWPP